VNIVRDSSSSTFQSKWAGPLLAFVFVGATIALSIVLLRRETWRRDTHTASARADTVRLGTGTDDAPVRDHPADEMAYIAESLAAYRGEGPAKRRLPMRPQPLKRWSDPTKNVKDAALWAWGERGRPSALVIIERFADSGSGESPVIGGFELVSLADEVLEVEGTNDILAENARTVADLKPVMTGDVRWNPKRSGFALRDVPNAPRPALTAPSRLVQMNDLIRRFSAVAHPGRPSQLALLPDPIDRYSDAEAGQVDGAIFLLAIGTNAEVMVVLEAQGPIPEKASWRYAVARATAAPFEVAIDGKQVFAAPYHSKEVNVPSGPYFVVGMPRPRSPK
jgi:hypothetical protein